MAETHSEKWRMLKNKTFSLLPPDADSLRQHCIRANYLAYLVHHPSVKQHPSPLGHGWELVNGRCRPVRHTRPALPPHLPTLGSAEQSESDDSDDEQDDAQEGRRHSSESDDSEYSETQCSDSD